MTSDEAIKILKSKMDGSVDTSYEWAETVRMAIEALQNLSKPNNGSQGSNLISRQDAIDAFGLSEKTRKYGGDHSGYDTMMLYEIQDVLESLPSADEQDDNRLYIRIYANDEPSRKAEKLYQICGETESQEVAQWLKEYFPSADRSAEWIPFKKRPLTDEEKEEYPDWIYIFDCPLPDDEEEILLSNGKHVWTDTFIDDGECYLDGGDDIDEGMAWMPMPEPWKDGE